MLQYVALQDVVRFQRLSASACQRRAVAWCRSGHCHEPFRKG